MPNTSSGRLCAWLDDGSPSMVGVTGPTQLMDCFLGNADEAAFAVLVRRHGPMVLRVRRGVLIQAHGAEDAFQYTFLLLVRRAGAIHRG
jgi:hypothetical protein